MSTPLEQIEVEAQGLRFVGFAGGQGPLVLCAHGFPETASTFDATIHYVAARGYRGVALNLRGYWPSDTSASSFHATEVAEDLVALAEKLSPESPAVLVGHDWGASAGYWAAALRPERFSRLITIGIPHPRTIRMSPAALAMGIWGLRHFLTFQWKARTLRMFRRDDFAFVDRLYDRCSPDWRHGPEETAPVKEAFRHEGCLEGALGYYWDAFRAPALVRDRERELSQKPIAVPTSVVLGAADNVVRLRRGRDGGGPLRSRPDLFPNGVTIHWIEGAGHFPHREDFAAFARILDGLLPQRIG